jgi:hypothetical protein
MSGFPIVLTIPSPFYNSQTSCEVDDINSISTVARFSRALPTTALSHEGLPTRMAATIAVRIPNGAIAKIKLSSHPTGYTLDLVEVEARRAEKWGGGKD